MVTNRPEFLIIVDDIPYTRVRYTTENAALKEALKMMWIAERKVEIVKVVQRLNVKTTLY